MPERRLSLGLDEVERIEIDCMSCHEPIPIPPLRTDSARRVVLQVCPWCRNPATIEEDREALLTLAGAFAALRRRIVDGAKSGHPHLRVRMLCRDVP